MKHLCALLLFSAAPLLASPAPAQTGSAHPPIVCDVIDKIEDEDAACQEKLKGLFTRNGDALSLSLDDGRTKTYVGNNAACHEPNTDVAKCLVYRMQGYFPQTRSYLVYGAFYECGVYLLVNRRSASEIQMRAMPAQSPDARYLLAIDTNEACDREFDIAIWSMQTDPPTLEFAYKAERYEMWEIAAWESDTRVKLKGLVNDGGGYNPYDLEAELVRTSGGWSLNLGRKSNPAEVEKPKH